MRFPHAIILLPMDIILERSADGVVCSSDEFTKSQGGEQK